MANVNGTLSADGQSAVLDVVQSNKVTMIITGDFGGGAVKMQILSDDGTTWRDVAFAEYLDDSTKVFEFPLGFKIRLDLSGSTTPSLYYELINHNARSN